jgi:hypothetical protein
VSAAGARNVTLSYDPLGRLFQVTGGGSTTQFLYDADELVAEYSFTGSLLRRYAHGVGTDDPVIWYEGSGLTTRRSLFADHQGSIAAVADFAGAKFVINAYDPWGIPNSTNLGRFQYTGQAWIGELGMYYYKPGSTRQPWGGSCRPIRSGMTIRSISMLMSAMIRSTSPIRPVRRATQVHALVHS